MDELCPPSADEANRRHGAIEIGTCRSSYRPRPKRDTLLAECMAGSAPIPLVKPWSRAGATCHFARRSIGLW